MALRDPWGDIRFLLCFVCLESRTTAIRWPHGCGNVFNKSYNNRAASVRWPYDVLNIVLPSCYHIVAAVRFLGNQDKAQTVGHLTVNARSPYDHYMVTLRYHTFFRGGGLRAPLQRQHATLAVATQSLCGCLTEWDLINRRISTKDHMI